MTSRQRMLAALDLQKPDRLPVTTHHVMEYYLEQYEGGADAEEFFRRHGLDSIVWMQPIQPDEQAGQYRADPASGYQGIVTDQWRITAELIEETPYETHRWRIATPKGELSLVLQSNGYTSWVSEPLIKQKRDIDIIGEYAPAFHCDREAVKEMSRRTGGNRIIRLTVPPFEIAGQPGCWQDASVLFGIEPLILETFDDPQWVGAFLEILRQRKLKYLESAAGTGADIIELGGGDASTTVISPRIFQEFAAPNDAPLIDAARRSGLRTVYHTCGGMMPILEDLAAMQPAALETFTPPGMGGDVDLTEAYRRIGGRVCFIGGFDQGYFFQRASIAEVQAEVRRCFEACGKAGGYIIAPSDHFFDAQPQLISAFASAARGCVYEQEHI